MNDKLLVFVFGLSFAFTGFVFEDSRRVDEAQNKRIDKVIQAIEKIAEADRVQAVKECSYLPTKEERLQCLEAITGKQEGGQ